jgi:hypothetical protein
VKNQIKVKLNKTTQTRVSKIVYDTAESYAYILYEKIQSIINDQTITVPGMEKPGRKNSRVEFFFFLFFLFFFGGIRILGCSQRLLFEIKSNQKPQTACSFLLCFCSLLF